MARKQNRASKRKVSALQNAAKVLELRAEGKSYSEISRQTGLARSYVHGLVIAEMVRAANENVKTAAQILADEWATSELLLIAAVLAVEEGDVSGINAGVRVLERRARYRGLDAPDKQEVNLTPAGAVLTTEQLRAELLREVSKMRAAKQAKESPK